MANWNMSSGMKRDRKDCETRTKCRWRDHSFRMRFWIWRTHSSAQLSRYRHPPEHLFWRLWISSCNAFNVVACSCCMKRIDFWRLSCLICVTAAIACKRKIRWVEINICFNDSLHLHPEGLFSRHFPMHGAIECELRVACHVRQSWATLHQNIKLWNETWNGRGCRKDVKKEQPYPSVCFLHNQIVLHSALPANF